MGEDTEAIEYIERSKTRNLVELILNRDIKTIFPPEIVTQLEQLRDEIASVQYQLQNSKAENPTVLAQRLQQLRQQRQVLQDSYLPVGSGFRFEKFQKTLDEHTAIIEWYIATDKILAFVIKPHGQELTLWQAQPEDLDALINWRNEYLRDYYNPNEQAFADACVMALLSTQTYQSLNIKCQSQGKLLGSPIYEYNNDADSPQEQCHILIWLNTNFQTTQLENDGEYYYPLINLLNYRSKIIYAHSQAIWCNQQAREEYSKLESKVIDFNDIKNLPVSSKLDKFSLWLNEIPEISFNYARQLRDLQIHKNTIQTNCQNYHLELDKINNICIQDNDLIFLSIFGKLAEDSYVEQINTDLGYLQPSQNLFDQMINTIRGIVEIEQAESDRSLERTIQVLGIAFGGGAIVSGVVTGHIDKPFAPQINFKYSVHPLVSSLLWSFLATAFFWLLARLLTKRKWS